MADDNFFGSLQSGFQDLLPNKITYATPEQIKAIRGTGENLYKGAQKPGVYTWGNAFGDIASKMMGGYMMSRAGELEKMGLEKGAAAVSSFAPSGGAAAAKPSVGGGDSAPTDGGGVAGATEGDASAATGAPEPDGRVIPTVNAADISARLETGSSDPTKSMANISPDTRGSKSYGSFGLNSQPGYSAHDFKRDYGEQLGLTATPGTPEFDAQWRQSVKDNPVAHRSAEIDWYNKNIAAGVPGKLERVGVGADIAADPRVMAYFSDRVVQQGGGSITSNKHAARIQAAYEASGGDPIRFIKAMSLADRTPEALHADFPHALASGVYSQRGHDNRVMGREALALGLPMPAGGVGGGAPMARSGAIAPIVNALAGPGGNPAPSSLAGASIAPNPTAPGSLSTTMMGTLQAIGAPPPGGMAPGQQAIMSALRGGGGAPPPVNGPAPPINAPAALGRTRSLAPPPTAAPPAVAPPVSPATAASVQAIAGPKGAAPSPVGTGGAGIPPTLSMSALPDPNKIRAGLASDIPQIVEQAKQLNEYRIKALTPQQVSTPDGSIYVGTPYTGYQRMGLQGKPEIIKSPYEYPGGIKGEHLYTPGAGNTLTQMPIVPAGGAPAPAAGGGGLPPMPSPDNPAAMVDWASQANAQRKAQEATAEETAKGAAKPMVEAMEKASTTPDMIRKLDIMSNAYRQGGMSGGPLGPFLHDVRGVAAQLGLLDPKDKTLTAQNIIEKIGTQLAFQATKELTNRPAASEVLMQIKANPGLLMSNQSAMYMLDLMKQTALQDQKIGQIAMTAGMTPQRFAEMRDNYYRDNPLISPFTHRPINEMGGGIPGTKNGPLPQASGTPFSAGSSIGPGASGGGQTGVAAPAVGTIRNGYRFTGGNPAQKSSWEAVR
jgi:hypothetical protein